METKDARKRPRPQSSVDSVSSTSKRARYATHVVEALPNSDTDVDANLMLRPLTDTVEQTRRKVGFGFLHFLQSIHDGLQIICASLLVPKSRALRATR
jgi:hypothetical protein